MSTPEPDTLEREKDKLWVTDAEMIRRMGVPERTAREAIRVLDEQKCGFPPKEKLWGDRRYWPAIEAYFDRRYGVTLMQPKQRERA